MRPIISLLTDFGLKDPYVAQVKAVLLSYCRDAIIIDLTHDVEVFNEFQAAFLLKVSVLYMPTGTASKLTSLGANIRICRIASSLNLLQAF